jgi:hypothetical protein
VLDRMPCCWLESQHACDPIACLSGVLSLTGADIHHVATLKALAEKAMIWSDPSLAKRMPPPGSIGGGNSVGSTALAQFLC